MDTALDLPEIRALISIYLAPADLTSTRLVNKEWNLTSTPFLLRDLTFKDDSNTQLLLPSPHSSHTPTTLPAFPSFFTQNTQHIHRLDISQSDPTALFSLQGFSCLRHLSFTAAARFRRVDNGREQELNKILLLLASFIRSNGSLLETLKIKDCASLPDTFWDQISSGDHSPRKLWRLELAHGILMPKHLKDIWKALPRMGVHELYLDPDDIHDCSENEYSNWTEAQEQVVGYSLQKARLTRFSCASNYKWVLFLLKQWPGLKELSLEGRSDILWDDLAGALEEGAWKELEAIETLDDGIEDKDLARLITAMPKIKKLEMEDIDGFGQAACHALWDHPCAFAKIQTLKVRGNYQFDSAMVATVLEECSQLVELTAEILRGEDIVASLPWKCCGTLKSLTVDILLSGEAENDGLEAAFTEQNRAILERLGTLTQLETLRISSEVYEDDAGGCLSLQLEEGLGHLSGLSKLKDMELRRGTYFMVREDVEWIMDHWPRLRDTSINCGGNCVRMTPELEKRLLKRGIQLKAWRSS